ncbi:hypothetical protein L209DRAFT_779377 [Thermothelomyces heterothallicus CBS 203.75]
MQWEALSLPAGSPVRPPALLPARPAPQRAAGRVRPRAKRDDEDGGEIDRGGDNDDDEEDGFFKVKTEVQDDAETEDGGGGEGNRDEIKTESKDDTQIGCWVDVEVKKDEDVKMESDDEDDKAFLRVKNADGVTKMES